MNRSGKTGSDKRAAPRFSVSQMIEMRFGRERWVHARGLDISATGFRCRTMEPLDPGTSIFLLLSLGGDREITADAVLIHTAPDDDEGSGYTAGFAFTTVHHDSQAILDAFLSDLDSPDVSPAADRPTF